AWEILTEYREVLDELARRLLEEETLDAQELAEVFEPVVKRDPRPVWLSSQKRAVSDIPPVNVPAKMDLPAGENNVTETPVETGDD
ncbi:MAG TPA: cell division protein FtsH, partial [Beutenbergiaceae bacterium]|nr:cell division protein FtsH [Beutenbergiaceae bacterium]